MAILADIETIIKANGFPRFGLTPLKEPISIDHYKKWINKGFHGEMFYLSEHLAIKTNPQKHYPKIKTAIVVAEPYFPHPQPAPFSVRTALYAQGQDYHQWLTNKLKLVCDRLSSQFPNEQFLCFTDSAPVLERELAYLSGLGWVGKNTCLIHPQHGSLWFIGEIYSSVDFNESIHPQLPDMCGTCDRCITACPTGAIEAPRVLNATKCISYWNIEAKTIAPEPIRTQMGDWFFGCDICQTVCPWNEKVFAKDQMRPRSASLSALDEEGLRFLREVLALSNKELMRKYKDHPYSRARGRGLKRNALVVIANLKLVELRPNVEAFVPLDEEMGQLKDWTLAHL